ncbi:MAG TPA: 3-isopropylmalate dehydratase small subunit [Mycobacteriales bacterium]|nr:3-isopropylmalate dehydratase small subunit [Mycobacteriales bacterium]
MEPIRVHTGRAVPLRRSDVDTDQIIPSDWLKRVERTGFGAGLFAQWRAEPGFVLDDPAYAGASVLVAGGNFGTGSSREHAVWALEDFGFRAVVSPRLADIFRNNCTKVGLVPVEVDDRVVERLWSAIEADPSAEVVVDVEARRMRCAAAGVDAPFALDDFTRWRLMEGLDDIGLTLRHEAAITAFERRRDSRRPTTVRHSGP